MGRGSGGGDAGRVVAEHIQLILSAKGDVAQIEHSLNVLRQLSAVSKEAAAFLGTYSSAAMGAARASGVLAEAEEASKASIQSKVAAAQKAARDIQVYAKALEGLNQRRKAGDYGPGDDALHDTIEGLNLGREALGEFQDKLAKAPPGVLALADAVRIADKELKEQERLLKGSAVAATDYAKKYEAAARGMQLAERTRSSLGRTLIAQRDDPLGPGNPFETAAALRMAREESARYKAVLDQLPPGTRAYTEALRAEEAALKAQDAALRRSSTSMRVHADETTKGARSAADIARGLASSVFGFSLLAGGMVAAGHLIGNTYTNAVQSAHRLQESVDNIAQLSPSMDTDVLFDQFTDIERRAGILSQKLIEVFRYAAPLARGDDQKSLDLTEELAKGAQGARAPSTAWAEAATSTLRAYRMEVEELGHVQDVLTIAMQNSAGQGDALLRVWGSVSKAAANSGTDFEDVSAQMIMLAQNGGDLEENLRALKGAYDALATERTRSAIEAQGLAWRDYAGNLYGLPEIIEQIKVQLGDLTGEGRSTALNTIVGRMFEDRDVRNVIKTLIDGNTSITASALETANSYGAASRAHSDWMDQATAKQERLDALMQSYNEKLGRTLDLQRRVAELLSSVDMDFQLQVFGGDQGLSERQLEEVRRFMGQRTQYPDITNGFSPFNNSAIERDLPELKRRLDEIAEAERVLQHEGARLGDTHAEMTAGMRQAAMATREQADAVSEASAAYSLFIEWQGQVLDGSSYLQPSLEGVSTRINELYARAVALSREGSFDGFATAAERDLARVGSAIEKLVMGISDPNAPSGIVEAARAQLQPLIDQARALAEQIEARSPEAQERRANAVREYVDFRNERRMAEDLAAAELNLASVTEYYNGKLKALTDQQQELQRVLRNNGTPELSSAYKELTDATTDLEAIQARYKSTLSALNQELRETQAAAAQSLQPLRQTAEGARTDLSDFNNSERARLAEFNSELERLQGNVERAKTAASTMLDPFLSNVARARGALEEFNKQTELNMRSFDRMERGLEKLGRETDRRASEALKPLQDEVRRYQEQLRDLDRRESDTLTPLDDEIYSATEALRDRRAAVEELSASYERRLLPVQRELNRLREEERRERAAEELRNQRLTADNLAAQLAQTRYGTSDFRSLQLQLVAATRTADRTARINALEAQQSEIVSERDDALSSAKESLATEEAHLEALQRRREEQRRNFELERRGIEDNRRRAQEAYDKEKEYWDAQKEANRVMLEGLRDARAAYADMRAEQQVAYADAVVLSQSLLLGAQGLANAYVGAAQAIVTGYTEMGKIQETWANTSRAELEGYVATAEANLKKAETHWNGVTGAIQNDIYWMEQARDTEVEQGQSRVKAAQTNYDNLRRIVQDQINKLADEINTLRDTASEAEKSAKRQVDAQRAIQKAYKDTLANAEALRKYMEDGKAPAASSMPTTPEYAGDQGAAGEKPYTPPATPVLPPIPNPVDNRRPDSRLPESYAPTAPTNPNTRDAQGKSGEGSGTYGRLWSDTVELTRAGQAPAQGPGAQVPILPGDAGTGRTSGDVSVTVALSVAPNMAIGNGNPNDPSYWDPMSEAIFSSVRRIVRSRSGLDFSMEYS